jgi:PTS system mannose-specific IIC component
VVGIAQYLLAGLWGGLMALERRAFLQAMISRPLVAATVTGLLLDDLNGGVAVGVVFELFYLGAISLGGAQPDHETLPAVAAASLVSTMGNALGGDSTPAMWAFAILLFAPTGRLGRIMETALDQRARRYFGAAVKAAASGEMHRAARQNLTAMWPQFALYGVLCFLAAWLGAVLAPLEAQLPLPLLRGLAWAWPALGTVAAGVAVQSGQVVGKKRTAAVAAAVVMGVMLGLGVLARAP